MRTVDFVPREFTLVCLAVVGCALAGCAETRGGRIPYNVSDFGPPDSPALEPLAAGYKIAPLDVLTVRVFGLDNLTGDYQVDLRGKVAMPLIGDVTAMNLTPAEFDELLTSKYSEKYLEDPDISVGLKESSGRVVTVDGAVTEGGMFPVRGAMTLMQAVALAGGVDEKTANPRRVAIFRTIGGKRQAAAFDLVSIRRGEMEDPPVYSGDVVVVDGSRLKDAQEKLLRALGPLSVVFQPVAF